MIGTILIFIKVKNINKFICGSLSFASGVMICVSITDLIPEALNMLKINFNGFYSILLCLIFIVLGIVVSMLIDYYLPSDSLYENKKLYRVGLISMLAIILHNIPEDCSCYVSHHKYNIGLKFKNYQDNLYYYFGSLFSFYMYYFSSFSIKFLI